MAKRQTSGARRWGFPVAIVALALLAIATIIIRETGDAPTAQPSPSQSVASEAPEPEDSGSLEEVDLTVLERRDEADNLSAGAVDAPVGLVVYSDYQCPYCGQWSEETLPLMMEYVEAGDLRIEWRDVEIFGEESGRAARAAYAAGEQGAFWDYHEALFPSGEPLTTTGITDDDFVALAGEVGLDVAQFEQDLASEKTLMGTQANHYEAINIGVTATPAFIVGGQPLIGAQPSQIFVDAVEQALAAAGE